MTNGDWGVSKEIWRTIRPPLVPCEQDIELLFQACGPELLARPNGRVLVLGVTPALICAPWPTGFEFCAVDFDPKMISALWPDGLPERASVTCADWKEMPFPDDHFDLVIGDCSFCALPSLGDSFDVLKEVLRVKRSEAPIISRFFIRPDMDLSLRKLPDLIKEPRFSTFSPSEVRLLISISARGEDAVTKFDDVPKLIEEVWGNFDAYLVALGQMDVDAARTKATFSLPHRINYPSLEQIKGQFSAFGLSPQAHSPDYPSGLFCPTIHFMAP
jgi:hypothetical protein